MIKDNQQLSEYVPSEIDNQSLNMQSDNCDPELSNQAEDLPILKQYLSTNYQIFQDQNVGLDQITPIKNKIDFDKKRIAMRSYFTQQQSRNGNVLEYRKQKDQISSQFAVNFQNIPPYSIIYVCVNELDAGRCNILVRNSKGECLAYFYKQRKCKKLSKIFKLLGRVKKPAMALIIDRTVEQQVNILQIQKLTNVVQDFLYLFQNAEHIEVKINASNLRSEVYEQKDQNCTVQLANNQLRIISPNISSITETDAIDILVQNIQSFEQEEAEALRAVKGPCGQNQRNLQFDFIFINVYRIFGCSPRQTIDKIQKLLMKQQQIFNQRDSKQKQKQIQRQQNRDPNNHFPYKMKQSKSCKRCQLSYKKKLAKVNIGCEGCSVKFKKDIHLCAQCFKEFHQKIDFYSSRLRLGRLGNKKKTTKKSIAQKDHLNEEISNEYTEEKQNKINLRNTGDKNDKKNKSKINQKDVPIDQTSKKIIKLDDLLTQTFELANKFISEGHFKLMEGFFNDSFDKTLEKMHIIAQKQSHRNAQNSEKRQNIDENDNNNKLTSFGSLVYQNINKYISEKNQYFSQRIKLKKEHQADKEININNDKKNQNRIKIKEQFEF